MSVIPRVVVQRWLEATLALFSLGLLYLIYHPDSWPRALDLNVYAGLTPWEWIFRSMAFGLFGVWGFSALIVAFFLLYSPIYLINKMPHLIGKGGWLDRREVRFYLACFALACLLLVALFTRSFDTAGGLFVILAGFGPPIWRRLV
jgi:hypothetical protein